MTLIMVSTEYTSLDEAISAAALFSADSEVRWIIKIIEALPSSACCWTECIETPYLPNFVSNDGIIAEQPVLILYRGIDYIRNDRGTRR